MEITNDLKSPTADSLLTWEVPDPVFHFRYKLHLLHMQTHWFWEDRSPENGKELLQN